MNDEIIIRQEARSFYDFQLGGKYQEPFKKFHELKERLSDFYSDESKGVFLDEIQTCLLDGLIKHRNVKHAGQAEPNCPEEIHAEKFLFYIRQELGALPLIAHQSHKSNPEQLRDKVFVSYSHKDKEFLKDIQRHFKPFVNQINFWDDTKIQPGQKWKEEIEKAISETKVAIVLLSTDFLGSDFILSNELPPLLKAAEENGALIITVILKPCLFEEFPNLNQYQALNPPSRPLMTMDEAEKEFTLVNLVRQTKKILEV